MHSSTCPLSVLPGLFFQAQRVEQKPTNMVAFAIVLSAIPTLGQREGRVAVKCEGDVEKRSEQTELPLSAAAHTHACTHTAW